MKTRLHLFEPSSCSHTVADSVNIASMPYSECIYSNYYVCTNSAIDAEDEMVPLKVEVTHPNPAQIPRCGTFRTLKLRTKTRIVVDTN